MSQGEHYEMNQGKMPKPMFGKEDPCVVFHIGDKVAGKPLC